MKKFPVLISSAEGNYKRSLTMAYIEFCFVICAACTIEKHRNYFNLHFVFPAGEYNKSVVVKRIPNGYINKFEVKK